MKIASLVFALILSSARLFSQSTTWNQGPEYIVAVRSQSAVTNTIVAPFYSSFVLTFVFQSDLSNRSQVISVPSAPGSAPNACPIDFVALSQKTVTISGTQYTYAQGMQILLAIITQERAAQVASYNSPTPTPTSAPTVTPTP